MVLSAFVLAWSISAWCPTVDYYRSQGYTDAQIEAGAREQRVPEWVIKLAKRRCIAH